MLTDGEIRDKREMKQSLMMRWRPDDDSEDELEGVRDFVYCNLMDALSF